MSTTQVNIPASRCRLGMGRCDITPPIGIYHRFWGAASHDRATGVHQKLTAIVMVLQGLESSPEEFPVFVAIDHCLLRAPEMETLLQGCSRLMGVAPERLVFAFSHTHSAGNFSRDREHLPGGEWIGSYLDSLPERIAAAFRTATASQQPVTLTYASTTCNMGHHRDYWDADRAAYVCGFNPEQSIDLPLHVIRATDEQDRIVATMVNYPCHPTTLAWQNTLISPDYVGELRRVVEEATGAPCGFLLAPCGDIGPREGFVGETEIAERNGRQVAYASLSALESMPPAGTDLHYTGPVLSGATLGTWQPQSHSTARQVETAIVRYRSWHIDVPYLSHLPTIDQAEGELHQFLARETEAVSQNDQPRIREMRALAERKRRLLERIRPLPPGKHYPYPLRAWQFGDAFWVAVEGEPYHWLQQELRRRFPDVPIIAITLANGSRCSYLPARDDYGKPLYQVDVALLAPGCLEIITDELAAQIQVWRETVSGSTNAPQPA